MIVNNAIGEVCSVRISFLQNKGILDTPNWQMGAHANTNSLSFSDLGLQSYQILRFVTNMNPSRVSA